MPEAHDLARANSIDLIGLTGTHGGVIGSLAAVGLRTWGNDGRFLWLPELRTLTGIHTAAGIAARVPVDGIETEAGIAARPDDRICIADWPRPIMRAGRAILLIEETEHEDYDWIIAAKPRVKALSG